MKLQVTLNTNGTISMVNPDQWELKVGETVVFVPESGLAELRLRIKELEAGLHAIHRDTQNPVVKIFVKAILAGKGPRPNEPTEKG